MNIATLTQGSSYSFQTEKTNVFCFFFWVSVRSSSPNFGFPLCSIIVPALQSSTFLPDKMTDFVCIQRIRLNAKVQISFEMLETSAKCKRMQITVVQKLEQSHQCCYNSKLKSVKLPSLHIQNAWSRSFLSIAFQSVNQFYKTLQRFLRQIEY